MKVILALVSLPLLVSAFEDDAANLFQKYREIKGDIINHEESKRRVLADLFNVTLGMKKINKRRELLMNEKHYVELRIRETTINLEKLKVKLDGQRERLRSRMRGLYKFNGQSAMRLIFSSQTPNDLDRNLQILKILADKDYVLIRAYEKNFSAYAKQTAKLEGHKRRLLSIEDELKGHEQELVTQQEEKNRIVEGIDRETLTQLIRLGNIRAEGSKIAQAEGAPALKFNQSFFEARGRLPKPVEGEILQGFGPMEEAKYGIKLRSKGVFISSQEGSEIKSVFDGEVLWSEYVPGFGKTLVIHHGDRYYSVYGNNSRLSVKRGERVSAGEVIAFAGPAWRGLGSGSYFELRHFSDLMNPEDWFYSENKKDSNTASVGNIEEGNL